MDSISAPASSFAYVTQAYEELQLELEVVATVQ